MGRPDVACCNSAPAAIKRPAGRFILRDKHRPSADPEPPSASFPTDDRGPAAELPTAPSELGPAAASYVQMLKAHREFLECKTALCSCQSRKKRQI